MLFIIRQACAQGPCRTDPIRPMCSRSCLYVVCCTYVSAPEELSSAAPSECVCNTFSLSNLLSVVPCNPGRCTTTQQAALRNGGTKQFPLVYHFFDDPAYRCTTTPRTASCSTARATVPRCMATTCTTTGTPGCPFTRAPTALSTRTDFSRTHVSSNASV